MNKVILTGRLTRDPEVKDNNSGTAYCKYGLAVDRYVKDNKEKSVDFIDCVIFGKAVDSAKKYLRKGVKIALMGRLSTGKYVNREGKNVYTLDVVVESWEFAESKKNTDQRDGISTTPDGFLDIPDWLEEELPFA